MTTGPQVIEEETTAGNPIPPLRKERRAGAGRLQSTASRYALVGVWALMFAMFSVLEPDTFFSLQTVSAILGSQSVLLLLATAALCTFVVGEFDLSFAAVMGLSATTLLVLAGTHGVNIVIACIAAIGVAVLCGIVNAIFIVLLDVPSLIVTLGMATFLQGIAVALTSSNTLSLFNPSFSDFAVSEVLGLPLSFYYAVAVVALFAYVLAWTPVGRHMTFVGANKEVARLAGIRVQLIRAMSYVVGAGLAGFAGVVLVASVGGFDASGSSTYLLPALAAVFLGTAVVQPGQFNPVGTLIGIYFLQTGIFGLQLMGYSGWIQDAFYGAGLVIAVTATALIRRRSTRS